ncbi:hypothetical protein ACFV08_05570 [Streptomyces fradiae]|uniref:hypothetical protein n=1 Tax=Streptomyces fradiae TaxID=1906 RepID=UPI0036BCD582
MESAQDVAVRVREAEDPLFGAVTVELDTAAGMVEVRGDTVPQIVLRRAVGVREVDEHIPVGTRDGALLSLAVDGAAVQVRPGKGRLTRRSFRVDVTYEGIVYRLVPDSLAGSRLLRDGDPLGWLESVGDGDVSARWRDGACVRAVEAAIGYALAAGFGIGAQPMWALALEALGDLLPN